MKKYTLGIFVAVFSLSFVSLVSAHSTVSPSQSTTQKYENFTLSVPTEKEVPTVGVRVLIPETLDRVTPFVKSGWTINITKAGEKVTQIEWTGGTIPAGQKDVFLFTARTPAEDTTLIWKVYQTYQGGEVVAWDQDPKSAEEVSKPYSTTEVKIDSASTVDSRPSRDKYQIAIAWAAIAISLVALWRSSRK